MIKLQALGTLPRNREQYEVLQAKKVVFKVPAKPKWKADYASKMNNKRTYTVPGATGLDRNAAYPAAKNRGGQVLKGNEKGAWKLMPTPMNPPSPSDITRQGVMDCSAQEIAELEECGVLCACCNKSAGVIGCSVGKCAKNHNANQMPHWVEYLHHAKPPGSTPSKYTQVFVCAVCAAAAVLQDRQNLVNVETEKFQPLLSPSINEVLICEDDKIVVMRVDIGYLGSVYRWDTPYICPQCKLYSGYKGIVPGVHLTPGRTIHEAGIVADFLTCGANPLQLSRGVYASETMQGLLTAGDDLPSVYRRLTEEFAAEGEGGSPQGGGQSPQAGGQALLDKRINNLSSELDGRVLTDDSATPGEYNQSTADRCLEGASAAASPTQSPQEFAAEDSIAEAASALIEFSSQRERLIERLEQNPYGFDIPQTPNHFGSLRQGVESLIPPFTPFTPGDAESIMGAVSTPYGT